MRRKDQKEKFYSTGKNPFMIKLVNSFYCWDCYYSRMINYDMQQALCGPQSTTNTNNSARGSPHLYHQQQQHHHPQQLLHLSQQSQHHHRLKNEPFSPSMSLGSGNSRSSTMDTNSSPHNSLSRTPTPSQQHQSPSSLQRSIDYANSSSCPEPSLKHARFDHTVWPSTT